MNYRQTVLAMKGRGRAEHEKAISQAIGQVFQERLVLRLEGWKGPEGRQRLYFLAMCLRCGQEKVERIDNLKRSGCRCGRVKGGVSRHPLYSIWRGIRDRCHPTRGHKDYGLRGIRVCERWHSSFKRFVEDMGERPEGTSIERIDVNGDYEPNNCRWATPQEQNENKRTTIWVRNNGRRWCLGALARAHGLSRKTVMNRYNRGWPDEALTLPAGSRWDGPRRVDRIKDYAFC